MLKSFRNVLIVMVLLWWNLSAGVAVADAPNLEDVTDQFKDTPDGWRLHVSLYNMSVTSVPNMAATAFTREAFASATAEVWIEPLHPDEPAPKWTEVRQRSIVLWAEQGCQVKLSNTTLGDNNTSSGSVTDTATSNAGPGGSSTGTSNQVSPNVSENNNPSVQSVVGPGGIDRKMLASKAFPDIKWDPEALKKDPKTPPWVGPGWSNDKLTIAVRLWDFKVDSCAGPVSFRFQAGATMSTLHSDDNVDAYSAIVQI